jgi:hypothetical protein
LLPFFLFSVIHNIVFLHEIMTAIGLILNCSWY